MKKITVFTPTYNRAYCLSKLYDSLCNQNNKDFLWLIVDDGSNDNTCQLVKKWKDEGKIEILYFRQENRGKMAAHNVAVQKCFTDFFVCVDSDDYLVNNDVISDTLNATKGILQNEIAGVITYRKMISFDDHHSCFKFGDVKKLSEIYECGFIGESTIIFKTNVIKEYLFPEIVGEKFITEKYIYDQIDQKYKYFLLEKPLIACDYFQDGYTKNMNATLLKNPKGVALYYNQAMVLNKIDLKKMITYCMLYIAYSKLGKSHNIYRDCKCKSKIIFFIAFILYLIFKRKILKH